MFPLNIKNPLASTPSHKFITCLQKLMSDFIKFVLNNPYHFFHFLLLTGTRIIYERAFLMNLKNSPLSRTPPSNVPSTLIRGCKNVPMSKLNGNRYQTTHNSVSRSPPKQREEHQFDMEL